MRALLLLETQIGSRWKWKQRIFNENKYPPPLSLSLSLYDPSVAPRPGLGLPAEQAARRMGGRAGHGHRGGLRGPGGLLPPEEQAEEGLLPPEAGGGIPHGSGHVLRPRRYTADDDV